MNDSEKRQYHGQKVVAAARVFDALRWVAQEARAAKLTGVQLPAGSRLREALAALEQAYEAC